MGAPSDVNLKTSFKVSLATQYKKTDQSLNAQNLLDNINLRLGYQLLHGAGQDKANLQWYSTRRLVSTSETINPDGGISDNFGNVLDFDAVKVLIIHNLETSTDRFLQVTFKSERYNINSSGIRAIYEPFHGGIEAFTLSDSEEEGLITITSNADITYDIIALGSHAESSSNSGV